MERYFPSHPDYESPRQAAKRTATASRGMRLMLKKILAHKEKRATELRKEQGLILHRRKAKRKKS